MNLAKNITYVWEGERADLVLWLCSINNDGLLSKNSASDMAPQMRFKWADQAQAQARQNE